MADGSGSVPEMTEEFKKYDDAIGWMVKNWKDNKEVFTLASQMEVLGKNWAKLSGATDTESRKKARIVWQKAAQQYFDLVWAVVEAKIDAGPPDELVFDTHERLVIDFGHLSSQYTTFNPAFADQINERSAVDIYQYNRLTDYFKENYALIFDKPYNGPEGGVPLDEKLERFNNELKAAQNRRRMVMSTLMTGTNIIEKDELDSMLDKLDKGLADATETDMRTKRIREADNKARDSIRENCKNYETAERMFWYMIENLERKLTKADEPKKTEPAADGSTPAQTEAEVQKSAIDLFDPFAEIDDVPSAAAPAPASLPETETAAPDVPEDDVEYEGSIDEQPKPADEPAKKGPAEAVDQSLKIIENVLALHDKTKFLASLIVHVTNEAERWKTRKAMSQKKFKGQGLPAMKLALRESFNNKRQFMMLAARSAKIDTSPLCQNKSMPLSPKRAGEIMMDLTPLDPDMLRSARIRMYGIPRVILVPGQGLGAYDWEDNSLIIPIFPAVSDVKDISYALGAFRWDNDEDRTLKDTYVLLKINKGKGIRQLQETFFVDYFLWISKERKGFKVLSKESSKWFKTFFKQKSGATASENRLKKNM
ncbi:hypothetical protein FACS1894167_06660 [Synergistales bacterium]|nr:hypothetical protein FACS1894167_06660 [Synergistales bacterium]